MRLIQINGKRFQALEYKVPIWGDWYITDTGEAIQCAGPSGAEAIRLIIQPIENTGEKG
jgi:hypothetical protein